MKPFFVISVLFVSLLWSVSQSVAQSSAENGDLLGTAISAVTSEDWVTADHYASQISDPVGADIVTWARLRKGEGDWWEYQDFLSRNGDWPGLKLLRKKGEAAIPRNRNATEVRAFFATQPPQTGTGSLRLIKAFKDQGRTSDARTEAIRAWSDLSLTNNEQAELLSRFQGALAQYHLTRLDNLLWRGYTREAEAMLELVPVGQQKLAAARIALRRASKGVDALIEAVPQALKDDPGLAYDRFIWRVKKGRWDDAQALLVDRTDREARLGKAEAWANRRRGFARRAMRADQAELAYKLASQHFLTDGSDYADLEWLSGFIALRKLDKPAVALKHFERFRAAVASPISFGRAGYWIGRAQDALKNPGEAAKAYEFAAKYQTSFYGQLAAERAGAAPDPSLSGKSDASNWRQAAFLSSSPVRAGLLLLAAQEKPLARRFFTHVTESLSFADAILLSEMALELKQPHIALRIAKEAAKKGYVLPKPYFPVTELAHFSVDVEPEVAMAIARRESELDAEVISPAGARGLMQIMPATARQVSEDLGVEFSKHRLTSDWRYNATLGTAYLGGLLEIYEGSYPLAFAAYNAGPHRADKWIGLYGDPRDGVVDQVDWVEHIPYRETRNYVMRVMESLHVYRMRLSGQVGPIQLSLDLASSYP